MWLYCYRAAAIFSANTSSSRLGYIGDLFIQSIISISEIDLS